jgi:hypothetical protein
MTGKLEHGLHRSQGETRIKRLPDGRQGFKNQRKSAFPARIRIIRVLI